MIKKMIPLSLTFLLIGLAACASARLSAPETGAQSPPVAEAPAFDQAAGSPSIGVARQTQSETVPGVPPAQAERLVIKNGSLSIVVDDPVKSMDKVTSLADELGGFVVSANLSETILDSGLKAPRASITIRVPADRFNEALKRIKEETIQLPLSETISSQDVTSEYTDLKSRLRNLEAAEAQLTEIMGSAIRTEDVLAVYNQLVQVREQIEVIKGQIQYYEQSAAMSAISIDLLANAAVQPLTIGGWQPVGVAKDAVQALINTMKGLGNFLIWLVLFILPVLVALYVIFVLPLSLIWRAWRRRRARAKLEQQGTPPAPPAQPAS